MFDYQHEDHGEGLDPVELQARFNKFFAILEELKRESDRGVAILGVSMLDERVTKLLQHLLVPCKQTQNLLGSANAPVGTFASRLDLAVAIGLIGQKEYRECNILRRIRNDFAHKFEVEFSFKDNRISDLCSNLGMSSGDYIINLIDADANQSATEAVGSELLEPIIDDSPRGRFIESVATVYECWLIRDYHTIHRKMKPSGVDEIDSGGIASS